MKKSKWGFQLLLAVLVISMNAWTFEWLRRLDVLWAMLFSFVVLGVLFVLAVRAEREIARKAEAEAMLARVTGERRP